MRISWNNSPTNEPGMMQISISDAWGEKIVKEDMTPEMVRKMADELHTVANEIEKRLSRHKTLMNIQNLVKNDRKIDAIRDMRSLTGCSLLDAKDIIEMMSAFHKGR